MTSSRPAGPPRDASIEPDEKDWTWVLTRACAECGYDARSVRRTEVKNRVYANASAWRGPLATPGADHRPDPGTWSTVEYACHVRDVHLVFVERVRSMLVADDPEFLDWDQDAAAVIGRYHDQDPEQVARELIAAAAEATRVYGSVTDDQWDRPGRRANGSEFTVDSLARYHLHDVEHHLVDVSRRQAGPGPGSSADPGRSAGPG